MVFLNEVQIFVKESKRLKYAFDTNPNKCQILSLFPWNTFLVESVPMGTCFVTEYGLMPAADHVLLQEYNLMAIK